MINANMVKELRGKTGAGIMECKKALKESNGNIEKAAGLIRKKGLDVALKKADRITAEGLVEIYTSEENNCAGIVELNCETDFVAANSEFKEAARNLAKQASISSALSLEKLLTEQYIGDLSYTVKDFITTLIAKLGENICLRRYDKFNVLSNIIQSYSHGSGRIGAIIEIQCTKNNEVVSEAAREIAMQIAAQNPLFISRASIDANMINKKREVYKNEAINEGKPEKVVEKIAEGKIQKYLKEVCLLEQAWVKNGEVSIGEYIKEKSEEADADITVIRFVRFERGEGVEKKHENLVVEIEKQIQNVK